MTTLMENKRPTGLRYALAIFMKALSAFWHDRCLDVAAILAFMTLFAIVPLLAISISVLSHLNIKQMEFAGILLRYFFPLQNYQQMITKNISDFTQNATSLGIFGTFILILLSFELMYTIEDSLDHIWRVQRSRSAGKRLVIYWANLTVSPVLLGLSLLFSSKIREKGFFEAIYHFGFIQNLQHILLPFVMIFFVFFLLYKLIPNARVGNRPAIVGSFFGAILFQISKGIFSYYVYHYSMFFKVYGILGIGFIFLIWVYISWCLVLGGAEIAVAIQYFDIPQDAATNHAASPLSQPSRSLYLAMAVLLTIYHHYLEGTYPVTRDELARQIGAPLQAIQDILNSLCSRHILGTSEVRGGSYVFHTAPENIKLSKIYALFNPLGGKPHFLKTIPHEKALNTWIDEIKTIPEKELENRTLVDLAILEETREPPADVSKNETAG
ncbi:MAG: hypothetical protein DSY91_01690 [Deltaproteobacteria bacterium]|nr:MAG: hypothetical protein DSY91_01690 [Deltaproteobacteria bacterium]